MKVSGEHFSVLGNTWGATRCVYFGDQLIKSQARMSINIGEGQ